MIDAKKNNGGAAFPKPYSTDEHSNPCNVGYEEQGMSLRDYFAGQALVGLLASGPHDCEAYGIAHDSYLHADAMLEASKK